MVEEKEKMNMVIKYFDGSHFVLDFENKNIAINDNGIFVNGERIHQWNDKKREVIHIIETSESPVRGSIVRASCGREMVFKEYVLVDCNDGRMCDKCYEVHRRNLLKDAARTYAFFEVMED